MNLMGNCRREFSGLAVALLVCAQGWADAVAAAPLAEFEPGRDLAASAAIMPDAGGRRGWSGFSFVTEFACTNAYDGPVVSKPGVFSFEISGKPDNRVYRFRMFGTRQYDPKCTETEVSADAESDPSAVVRVAGVCTCYSEPEQSSVGYRLALYVNGELIGSSSCERFQPNRKMAEPIRFAEGIDVRSVAIGDHAFPLAELFPHLPKPDGRYGTGPLAAWMTEVYCRARRNLPDRKAIESLDACFKASTAVDPRVWNARQKGVRFVETPELVVAVAKGCVTGNPILGVWNRTAGQALLADDGLAWGLQYVGARGETRRMRAFPWVSSVVMPACQPVSETALSPISSSVIAMSATDICSPVERSISSSRREGLRLYSSERVMRSSVVSPCAESTAATAAPVPTKRARNKAGVRILINRCICKSNFLHHPLHQM